MTQLSPVNSHHTGNDPEDGSPSRKQCLKDAHQVRPVPNSKTLQSPLTCQRAKSFRLRNNSAQIRVTRFTHSPVPRLSFSTCQSNCSGLRWNKSIIFLWTSNKLAPLRTSRISLDNKILGSRSRKWADEPCSGNRFPSHQRRRPDGPTSPPPRSLALI